MDLPEETSKPEESTPSENSFPEEPILPEGFTPIGDLAHMPRARRRRAQRMLVPPGEDERAAMLDDLARRAFPSFEFFLFAFLSGVILGAAYLLNAPALLLLGILLAPLMTPWVGLTLAAVTGSWRFFFLTLGGLLVALVLVFLTGTVAGLAGRLWENLPLFYARLYTHLWWADLLVVALGAALLAISFVRSEKKPVLASVMLAYGFFLPVSAAGIGLGMGNVAGGLTLWPDGVLVFIVHLALATVVGGIVLLVMHFKPLGAGGYILTIFLSLVLLTVLVSLTGLVTLIRNGISTARHLAPTPTFVVLRPSTPTGFHTLTPQVTILPSATISPSPTIQPTPEYAVIASAVGGGANLRTEPGAGMVITVIENGKLVQVLPDIQVVGSNTWVRVLYFDMEGWVLQSVLSATTLTPTAAPATATFTPNP